MTRSILRSILVLGALTLPAACDFPKPGDIPAHGGGGDDGPGGPGIDASLPGPDASLPDSGSPLCGNSRVDGDEQCDSGGVDTATCNRDCKRPVCGDGLLNRVAGEACDDGDTLDDGNGCDAQCHRNAVCGDRVVQSIFEACDDGNQSSADSCSADCKQAVITLGPVSDRSATDNNGNGTFDFLGQETSTGDAVFGGATGTGGVLQEIRIAFEFDTHALHKGYLMKEAHVGFFPSNISGGPKTLQIHGYIGNGAVELQDMTKTNLVTMFNAANLAPVSLDIKAFMQTAATEQYPFTGFLLRLDALPQDGFFNLGVPTSNNADPNARPRLDLLFCVDGDHVGTCD